MQLRPTLEDIPVVLNIQEVKTISVIGNLLGLPLDGPAPEYPVLGAYQVLRGPPEVAQEHPRPHTGVGLVLLVLVRLQDIVDRLGKSNHEVPALVSGDPLVRRQAIGADLILVYGICDVWD